MIFNKQGNYGRPNCTATLTGDGVVITGQKSAWVSNGTIAGVCLLYCAADSGSGPDPRRGCAVIVPLDAKGVSRARPLHNFRHRPPTPPPLYFPNLKLSNNNP